MSRKKLDIVIPAAGLGRRMKSYGPKALLPVGPESLVHRQIRLLRESYPVANVIVVAGFESDRVRRALPPGVRVVVNKNFETTNVARSIEMGLHRCARTHAALVVYGDLVFNPEAVAGLPLDRSSVLIDQTPDWRENEVGVNVVGGMALRFEYGLPAKWAHICLLAPREKHLFLHAARVGGRDRFLGYEILNEVIDAGGRFHAVAPDGLRLVEIDCSKDIEQVARFAG